MRLTAVTIHSVAQFYRMLAIIVLAVHLIFILWVVFGVLVARSRPRLRWLHMASLIWAILVELTTVPCPLTLLEDWLEANSGIQPYSGGFLLHYLDTLVYPDISPVLITVTGVLVCALNLGLYARALLGAGTKAAAK